MAISMKDVDVETGMIISGPYAGHKLEDVMEYLETRAATAKPDGARPDGSGGTETPPKQPTTPSPEEVLDAKVKTRTDPLAANIAATNARLEQEDEETFAATVKDYDKEFRDTKKTIRQLVAELKKTIAPEFRLQRGVHRHLYMMVKQQDPAVQAKILGTEETEVEASETAPPETPPPAAPPKAKTLPPTASPTPASRQAPPKKDEGKPKLVGNDKTLKQARAFGMSHDAYLLRLEADGQTQESLDAQTVNRHVATPGRRKTVFDRV